MVNSNPETVSTDFDISDALYFEPLTLEDVLEIVHVEQPLGVVVQLGGQTPLRLARGLEAAGVPILGTSPDAIDAAEDRGRFEALARELGVAQPPSGTALLGATRRRRWPTGSAIPCWSARPTCWAGAAMEIVYDDESLRDYFERGGAGGAGASGADRPLPRGRLRGRRRRASPTARACVIGGVMQHIEDAGIHSGDSACVLPPYLITEDAGRADAASTPARLRCALGRGRADQRAVRHQGRRGLRARGEPARRPAPSPSCPRPPACRSPSLAAAVMVGEDAGRAGPRRRRRCQPYVAVKEAVFPFNKLPGVDLILGPEMRSTGEVMGIADSFGMAFAKAQMQPTEPLPLEGAVFITVNDHDKETVVPIARRFHELGFRIFATEGTATAPPGSRGSRRARAQGVRGPAQRDRSAGLGPDSAADQHAARQADPAGRLHHPPPRRCSTACPTPRRCRRPRRPAMPSSRCGAASAGALAAGMACSSRDRRRVDIDTARDTAFVAGLRARGPRRGARAGAAGALFHLPHRRPRHRPPRQPAGGCGRRAPPFGGEPASPGSPSGSAPTCSFPTRGSTRWSSGSARGSTGSSTSAAGGGASVPDCRSPSPPGRPPRPAWPGCTGSWACPARWVAGCT